MGCQLSKLGRRCRVYKPHGTENTSSQQQQAKSPPARTKKQKVGSDAAAGTAEVIKACAAAAPTKAKLDPRDFMFMQLKAETKVKLPGTINGQQFIVDGCQDCDLYIMDACAMVTIDDCKNCRIFIGPTESSIFMRDCSNCKLACITRQLRTRDCHACDILLYTRTRPIIESSSRLGLGCYSSPYAGLAQQMGLAQLTPFHNFWSDVFDFTPDEGSSPAAGNKNSQHWHLLPARLGLQEHMGSVPGQVLQLLHGTLQPQGATEAAAVKQESKTASPAATLSETDQQAVICTAGQLCNLQETAEGCFAFLLFPPGQHAAVQQWVAAQFPGKVAESSLSSKCGTPADTPVEGTGAEAEAAVTTECVADVEDVTLDAIDDTVDPSHIHAIRQQDVTALNAPAGAQVANPDTLQPQHQQVLLRTNEAAISVDVMQSMAAAAGWTTAQVKQLSAAIKAADAAAVNSKSKRVCCIGLELQTNTVEQQQALCIEAAKLGALSCSSLKAAALFRHLGTDG